MSITRYISSTLLALLFVIASVVFPSTVAAQSAENDCTLPEFNIISSNNISAISGESFFYYIVTDEDVSYELDSSLPSGLSYSSAEQQITGIPAESSVGEHEIVFSSTNDCGTATDSVNLTVLSGETLAAGTTNDSGQAAASGDSVALNDIPETGIVADTALTILFYLLTLLLVAGWAGRRLQYAFAGDGGAVDDSTGDLRVIPSLESRYTTMVSSMRRNSNPSRKRFGDGMKR